MVEVRSLHRGRVCGSAPRTETGPGAWEWWPARRGEEPGPTLAGRARARKGPGRHLKG